MNPPKTVRYVPDGAKRMEIVKTGDWKRSMGSMDWRPRKEESHV
jgi:hypothetical protein